MIDNKKISKLYEILSKELFIYIYSFVKSKESAEDILHEAFIKLLVYTKNNKAQDKNLRAMLYVIAKNACIDYFRKQKRNNETCLNDNMKSPTEFLDDIGAAELQGKIDIFLEGCDAESRSIFIMKKELSLTYEEIASRLNISERTAKRKMKKIATKLAIELKGWNCMN